MAGTMRIGMVTTSKEEEEEAGDTTATTKSSPGDHTQSTRTERMAGTNLNSAIHFSYFH